MTNEVIEKDVTKKSFWSRRNLFAALGTAVIALIPMLFSWVWDVASENIKAIRELGARIKSLEDEKANNRAIWDAITENKNEAARQREDLRVMQRLFDREFVRSPGPKAAEPSQTQDVKPPPVDPEKFRTMMEQRYPQKK